MKTTFSKQEILQNKGCYNTQEASDWFDKLSTDQNVLTIAEILNSEINIKDKRWFVYNSCGLTLAEKKALGLLLAWAVLPIYENKYPDDSRIRDYLDGIEKFNKGEINEDELLILRHAANAAADAIYAVANAAAYVAYAVAADAADAACADADAKDLTYTQKLNLILLNFVK